MRALLTPEIAPRMGIVLFRPGSELMPLFMQGRILLEPEPERYSSFASGAVPAASQPLADDPAVRAVFRNEAVIRRAGGVECLESWLLREKGCQWPHSDWHSENMTTMRHAPGAIRLCWHCDNQLRDQFTERLESMATDNCARWVLSVVRRDLQVHTRILSVLVLIRTLLRLAHMDTPSPLTLLVTRKTPSKTSHLTTL